MSARGQAALIAVLALAAGCAPAAEAASTLPAGFPGLWSRPGGGCERGSDNALLRLQPDAMILYGQQSHFTRVERRGPREAVVQVDLLSGDVYERKTLRWRLSADGKTLTQTGDMGTSVRKRCP